MTTHSDGPVVAPKRETCEISHSYTPNSKVNFVYKSICPRNMDLLSQCESCGSYCESKTVFHPQPVMVVVELHEQQSRGDHVLVALGEPYLNFWWSGVKNSK